MRVRITKKIEVQVLKNENGDLMLRTIDKALPADFITHKVILKGEREIGCFVDPDPDPNKTYFRLIK